MKPTEKRQNKILNYLLLIITPFFFFNFWEISYYMVTLLFLTWIIIPIDYLKNRTSSILFDFSKGFYAIFVLTILFAIFKPTYILTIENATKQGSMILNQEFANRYNIVSYLDLSTYSNLHLSTNMSIARFNDSITLEQEEKIDRYGYLTLPEMLLEPVFLIILFYLGHLLINDQTN